MTKTNKELIADWKRTKNYDSYRKLKTKFRAMVMMSVNKYASASVSRNSLELEAWKLFNDAVNSYDPNKGAAFSTHLNFQLRKLDRFTKKYQNVARIPENLSSRIGEYDRAHSGLFQSLGHEPSHKQLAKTMKWTVGNVKRLEKSRRGDLFEGSFEEGFELSRPSADTNVILAQIKEELDPTEKKIFTALISGKNKKTLARELGISNGRLSQLTGKIAKKIRPHLSRHHGIGINL